MVATEEYTKIIRFRLQNPLPENEDGEVHHIVPKSCGGKDLQDNLIKLTVDEHVRCHKLLPEIYTTGKEHRAMCYAWRFIALTRNGILSEEEIAEARKIGVESRRGLPSGMKGKRHKPETLQKMSESHKGKHLSEEDKKKKSEAAKRRRKRQNDDN